MNCVKHPEKEATGVCVYCGKFHCAECLVEVNGKNYCRDCVGKAFDEKGNSNSQNPSINIVNSNNSSASSTSASSSSASNNYYQNYKVLPWYLQWVHIFWIGLCTGGIYWIVGPIIRASWNSNNH